MTECETLRLVSAATGEWRDAQAAVGEESITDWLLYTLSRQLPRVQYRKFNRIEEGRRFGADWDWVFLARSMSLIWRVQAKRISAGEDHYPDLARSNRHGMQIEMLLDSARNDNRAPMYAFYRSPNSSSASACMALKGRYDGVLIADAFQVYDLVKNGRARIHADQIAGISIPLSCLMCCPLSSKGQGPVGMVGHYFPRLLDEQGTGENLPLGQYRVPPPEFRFDRRGREPGISPLIESEFSFRYQNVKAVLLFDLWELTSAFAQPGTYEPPGT